MDHAEHGRSEPHGRGARADPLTGEVTWIVPARQGRPNLPATTCPFCPGGLEAPDPYDVLAFPNRWPPFPEGRAEIVLYTPDHDASFAHLSPAQAHRVVDLWAERSAALGADPGVAYVLVFENRGPEVGATIAHPHGQIFAFDAVPAAAAAELEGDRTALGLGPDAPGDRLVAEAPGGWRAWVPVAATWPYELLLAPEEAVPDLPSLDATGRDGLGRILVDLVGRLDRLFDAPMPFMLWFHQRPFDGGEWPAARLHAHIAPLYRGPGTPRFVAAGELGSGVWFNPVEPADAAARLRGLGVIQAHAPGRVVLIGDHTDHAGGISLAMAIDLGTTVTGERGGDRYRLRSEQLDGEADCRLRPVGEARTAAAPWAAFVASVAETLQLDPPAGGLTGFTGQVSSTVPIGSGLSSSAALELSLALAFGFDGTSLELARLGQRAEHRAVGVPCGLLDQLTSACGVDGHALLLDLADDVPADDMVVPVPVPDGVDVVVVHSGQERALAGSAYAERRAQCSRAAELVGPLPRASLVDVEAITDPVLRRRARHVATECARVRAAADALRAEDPAAVGRLMLESHASLRDDFEVSTGALDETVSRLMALPGVLGARLTGAGFGGCVVALCEPGAVPDPTVLTGRGWQVRPSAGASVHEVGSG